MRIPRRALLRFAAVAPLAGAAAGASRPRPRSFVDPQGAWRWADGREVALFGVNYNIASAAAFRFIKAAGASFESVIAQDFAHFRRLGLDALRLSFWGDWESSAADGRLIVNDHVRVLDQILARAGEAGLSCLLSPIVTYDASWPDRTDGPRTGLSSAFRKDALGTDPAAIAAQVQYLRQLLSRTNPLTGLRYADEPAIAAIEPINEPTHHSDDRYGSVRYINALADAVRSAGFIGPIVYNVSQDMGIAPAIAAAAVQGATFGWYPTGLQNGHDVGGNGLLLVDRYEQMRLPTLGARAKLVYEFDAADSMARYFYPAMARAFRSGGAQFAAMFAYDSLPIAAANAEFNDHFLNLAYTPGKAISAMIAACAMRELPRGQDAGAYPATMQFGGFRVDDRADLSELVDETRFLHSGSTPTAPPNPARLRQLAGCGTSPLVDYDGTGAWFLDRLAPGEWRLEVYPDAVEVANPFEFRRPSRPAVRIVHRARRWSVRLPDLGPGYGVERADENRMATQSDGSVALRPGVYRLTRAGVTPNAVVDPSFHAPPPDAFAPLIRHAPPASVTAGQTWNVHVEVVAPEAPRGVSLWLRTEKRLDEVAMTPGSGFSYHCRLDGARLAEGFLDYFIEAEVGKARILAPAGDGALPRDWDFPREGGFRVAVVAPDTPLALFDAARHGERVIVPYGGYTRFAAIHTTPAADGGVALRFDGSKLGEADERDLPAQRSWNGMLDTEGRDLSRMAGLVVEGRSLGPGGAVLGVILIERDGMAWGAPVRLGADGNPVTLALASLRPVRAAMLPRDFPKGINPWWLRVPTGRGGAGDRLRLADLQAVQITIGGRFLGATDAPAPVAEVQRLLLAR